MAKAKTIVIPTLATNVNSSFEISENMSPDIVGVKKGQRVQLVVSYEVIEKTKSFTILRANVISLRPVRRKF